MRTIRRIELAMDVFVLVLEELIFIKAYLSSFGIEMNDTFCIIHP